MQITHQMKIEQLDTHQELMGKQDVVFAAHWRIIATNEKTTVSCAGVQKLSTDNLQNFILYEQLTEEVVVAWVKKEMQKSNVNISEIEKNLTHEILETEKPKEQLKPVPWDLN